MRKRWLSSRSLALHLAVLVVAPGCLLAFWWQLHRAMAGNTLSWAYTFEWPIFSVIAVIGWWQLIHDDPKTVRGRGLGATVSGGPETERVPGSEPAASDPPPGWARAQGSLGPRRRSRGPAEAEDPELVAYNRYLAELAASDPRKTWRRG